MIKWEYLVLSSLKEIDMGLVGFKLNDEIIRFEVKDGERYKCSDDVNYKKYLSNGQNQILNELGDEGWELIKIRGKHASTYFFKRPL